MLLSTPLVFYYLINSPCFLTRTQSQFTFCFGRCWFQVTTYIFNSFLDCYSNLYEFDSCPDQNESVCNTWRSSSIAIKRAHSPLIARLSCVTQWCNCLFLKEAAEEEEDLYGRGSNCWPRRGVDAGGGGGDEEEHTMDIVSVVRGQTVQVVVLKM